ncbi:MAG: dacA, partial [Paenibacillus sp.]|nr:dacA [Paenibacillus sp.]
MGVWKLKRFSRITRYVSIMMSAVMLLHLYIYNPDRALAEEAADLTLNVKSAILMDAQSGQILFERNADQALPPASMTKMMTEYIVMEQIKSGKIKWEDQVATSKYASDVPGSGDLLANGEKLTVRQMFQAMSIYSGNDATVALAEHAGGTEADFARLMNEKAKQLGMTTAHFATATGLSRTDLKDVEGAPFYDGTENTVMSARDAATLAYRIVNDHPEVLEFAKTTSLKLRERDKSPMINWNWMLEGNSSVANFKKYAYPGLDGLKTGYTDEAGYCFTGTAVRNGMRLITVVMGTRTEAER